MQYLYNGRLYNVLALIPDGENALKHANCIMLRDLDASVLCSCDGWIVLASVHDMGQPVDKDTETDAQLLRRVAQNDHMINTAYLPTGIRLNAIADRLDCGAKSD